MMITFTYHSNYLDLKSELHHTVQVIAWICYSIHHPEVVYTYLQFATPSTHSNQLSQY